MKTYVLYHANCTDGFGAALAAWLKLGEENTEYIPVAYGNDLPTIEEHSTVYILDFSYCRETLLQMQKRVEKLVVLDHHATAQKELAGLEFAHFDMTKSGAVLAWEYFHPETPVPDMINYIQDRDLWQWKLPHSRAFSAGLRSLVQNFTLWREALYSRIRRELITNEGHAILRSEEKQISGMVKNMRLETVAGHTVPICNATTLMSEVAEELMAQYPVYPFVVVYLDKADYRRVYSLRSGPNFDCSTIAKAFGGGGHKQAAGFTIAARMPIDQIPQAQPYQPTLVKEEIPPIVATGGDGAGPTEPQPVTEIATTE